MMCPNCKEEIKEVVRSDIAGAVFISRDSGNPTAIVTPANFGLCKWEGCGEFGSESHGRFDNCDHDYILQLSESECYATYCDYPPNDGEAWLVTPHKNGQWYEWERVDDTISFSRDD